MDPEESHILACVFFPFTGRDSIIDNKGDSGKEDLGDCVCVCVCVCARARARVRVRVHVCV